MNEAWVVEMHEAFEPEFDALAEAVQTELLVAGDKSGGSQQCFYKGLIRQADERYGAHLRRLIHEES